MRESLRRAVEHDVLVPDQAAGAFRFRHALLAEAIYTTILPGEREELHARLAEELSREPRASAAELAPHWAAAGRAAEALAASVEAARQAEAVFGLAEARRAPGAGARPVARRPRRGRAHRPRPRRPLLLGRRTGQPDRRLAARRRDSRAARSGWSGTTTPPGPPSCTCAWASTCTRTAATTPGSPHSSAPSSSPRPPSAERARALGGVRHRVAAGLAVRGVTRGLRAGARARASRSAPSDLGPPSCGRSPCSAPTSPTSAAATRAWPGSGRSRAARRGERRPHGPPAGCTSPSPTC